MKLRITTSKHNIFLKFNNFNKGLDSRVHFPALVQTRFWSIDFMFAHFNIVSMNIRFNVHYKFIKIIGEKGDFSSNLAPNSAY